MSVSDAIHFCITRKEVCMNNTTKEILPITNGYLFEKENSIGFSYCVRKDMSNMGFVGIHKTHEGLIAFADSKATREYNDGRKEHEENRGEIQKVFANNRFIVVTYGNNELFS